MSIQVYQEERHMTEGVSYYQQIVIVPFYAFISCLGRVLNIKNINSSS